MSKDNIPPSPPINDTGKLSGTDAVTVGCKLPHGIVCELGKPGTDGYRRYVLFGANGGNGGRDGKAPRGLVVDGFGLTTIPVDFMQAWLKKNAQLDFVKSGAIFIHSNIENARGHAAANVGLTTGFEGLNSNAPPPGIEVDKEHLKQGNRDVEQLRMAGRA